MLGGTTLAGNVWTSPLRSGFSQTCTSTDGICDTSYTIQSTYNIDYKPLASTPIGQYDTKLSSVEKGGRVQVSLFP